MDTIILSIQNGEDKYTTTTAAEILNTILDTTSDELASLVKIIGVSISVAERGSDHGKTLARRLLAENVKLQKLRASTPLWRFLLETHTRSGQQLARDLKLTSESVKTVTIILTKLEDLRDTLVTFRNNLLLFKVRGPL